MQSYMLMSRRLVFVTCRVMYMSRRIVFVMQRVQNVHTSNSERTLGNYFATLKKIFSHVRDKI